jgi:hypothetical protein
MDSSAVESICTENKPASFTSVAILSKACFVEKIYKIFLTFLFSIVFLCQLDFFIQMIEPGGLD